MKNEKKPRNVGIWAFLNKIPAGTMFVPLVISAIICTITVECVLAQEWLVKDKRYGNF